MIQYQFCDSYLTSYEKALISESLIAELPEKILVQLYFNVRFLQVMFERGINYNQTFADRFKKIHSFIEKFIDPINFTLIRPNLLINVQQLSETLSTMFEPLGQIITKVEMYSILSYLELINRAQSQPESPYIVKMAIIASKFGLYSLDESKYSTLSYHSRLISDNEPSSNNSTNPRKRTRIQIKLIRQDLDSDLVFKDLRKQLEDLEPNSNLMKSLNKDQGIIVGVASTLLSDFFTSK